MEKSTIKKARPLMVQGTASHVGKSVLTAAILWLLKERGLKVAPFKAQNMALNSAVTPDGGEIGRAQAFQAEAAGIEPDVDMNPILLKPSADSVCQVIIRGKVYGNMSAAQYHGFKKEAKKYVLESYERLASRYDVVVIEGAGSPAEINLRENDIANMGVAELVDSPVILTGDIDRGGVFASIVGTLELLTDSERERVKAFIINKFRGDIGLLKPGLDFLEKRTSRPVIGVIPYFKDIRLPEEDGVALQGSIGNIKDGCANIAVIKLPRISNFTDFDPFRAEPSVNLSFIEEAAGLDGADAVIIPGTKNTIADLNWLKEKGFSGPLERLRKEGKTVAGICGGFQMLGSLIKDPYSMESAEKEAHGLGLIDGLTIMKKDKNTFRVRAEVKGSGEVSGYEIHMGETVTSESPFALISDRNGEKATLNDGAVSKDKLVWGTYIHGIFDNDRFRRSFIEGLRKNKNTDTAQAARPFIDSRKDAMKEAALVVKNNLDMEMLLSIIGL